MPPDPTLIEAENRFHKGIELTEAGKFKAAIVEFEASYELVPRPSIVYNLGVVYEKLFRYDEAIEYYQRYLRLAPEDDADRDEVLAAITRLQERFGSMTIYVNLAAEVWFDGRQMGDAPGVFVVPTGSHFLELRRSQCAPVRREVNITAQTSHKFYFELTPEQADTGLSPIWFWSSAAATLVFAGMGTYFALRTLDLNDEVESSDPLLPATQTLEDDRDEAALYTDIFLITAGAFGITTVVLALLTNWDGDTEKESPSKGMAQRDVRITPFFTSQAAGLTLQGGL